MSRHTHVYGWDEEPADERPSEFMTSTGYSLLSAYHVPHDLSRRAARRRRGGRGFPAVVIACIVLLLVCGVAIHAFVKLLHG
jgi:hypothetical protein